MKQKIYELSDKIPKKNIAWELGEDKHVFILKEKSKNRVMKKLIDLVGKNQHFRIHLDEIGSFVWNNINGKLTAVELGRMLEEKHGIEKIPQAQERVEKFLLMLLKNKFIKIS